MLFALFEQMDKGREIICDYCGRIYDRNLDVCPKCKLIALKSIALVNL